MLFYRYEALGTAAAAALAAAQRCLGEELSLSGRVLVAPEGINGTVQGDEKQIERYQNEVQKWFQEEIDWKRSQAEGSESQGKALFPDFVVKEVNELVGFGLQESEPLDVVAEAGTRLSPEEFHSRLETRKAEELCLIDVRNTFEYPGFWPSD